MSNCRQELLNNPAITFGVACNLGLLIAWQIKRMFIKEAK